MQIVKAFICMENIIKLLTINIVFENFFESIMKEVGRSLIYATTHRPAKNHQLQRFPYGDGIDDHVFENYHRDA